MIADQHQVARTKASAYASGSVGDEQDRDAEPPQHPHGQRSGGSGVPLVQMKAPREGEHLSSLQRAGHYSPGVSCHGGRRKARDLDEGDAHRIIHHVGERAEPRSQNQRHRGPPGAEPVRDRFGGSSDLIR